jgi:imidazoleglycerol phosphate synthase glutamine amidotransferase subunit HisH
MPAGSSPFVYFNHSYYVPEVEQASALCTYGVRYTAAIEDGNVFGVQFHPEKSGPDGLALLSAFATC